jgi:hypothetical protein
LRHRWKALFGVIGSRIGLREFKLVESLKELEVEESMELGNSTPLSISITSLSSLSTFLSSKFSGHFQKPLVNELLLTNLRSKPSGLELSNGVMNGWE